MELEDKTLVCSDCGGEFIFTVDEQEFYIEKGFENEPKRCKPCRQQRKAQRGGRGGFGRQREMHTATCADCGGVAEVPFKPRDDRPVYCRECFQKRKY
ncbi:MAG: zinc-ribbon domain containing protein [Candidatus Hydrothermarchaeales archaeon]